MLGFQLILFQVLIGFVVTAYMTLLLVCTYYVLGFVDVQFLNGVDQGFLRLLRCRTKLPLTTRSASTPRKAIFMYSDQQLVTGIALLVSGFSQLHYGVDAYHWQILVYLVWFSSLTHLTTLTVLRQYFGDNSAIRSWRIVFMLVTVVMLGVALAPTGCSSWLPAFRFGGDFSLGGIPVLCYFELVVPPYGDQAQMRSMVVSILVLFFGYLSRLVKLSSKASTFSKKWLRIVPGQDLPSRWTLRSLQSGSPA